MEGGIKIQERKILKKEKEIKEEIEKKRSNKKIWNTKKINETIISLEKGDKHIDTSCFFEGDIELKSPDIVFEYTPEELQEFSKCMADVTYFAKYCKIMTDDGNRYVNLRDYQVEALKIFQNNRNVVFLASRQIGKTVMTTIFIAWYICFHKERNILIVANKLSTTAEIIDKIRIIIKGLPFFLKPGIQANAVNSMKFDNGVRLYSQATTKTAAIGYTIHLLYADEFAHIHQNFIKEFYKSIYPTLSSSKISRIIITSTANGMNFFYDIYQGALEGKNSYVPYRVDWWQVPGRDEEWKRKEIANLGSEDLFNQEYGNQFMSNSRLLLDSETLKLLHRYKKKYVPTDLDCLVEYKELSEKLLFNKNVNIDKLSNEKIIITIDLSDGVGRDYTVFNIFKLNVQSEVQIRKNKNIVDESSFFNVKQIGIFRSNTNSVDECATLLEKLCLNVFNPKKLCIIIEINFKGQIIYNRMERNENFIADDIFFFMKHSQDSVEEKLGVKITKENKEIYFRELRNLIKNKKIIVEEERTIEELSSFGVSSHGKYVSQLQNDDAAMSTILLVPFFSSQYFFDMVEDSFDILPQKHQKLIDLKILKEDYNNREDDDKTEFMKILMGM